MRRTTSVAALAVLLLGPELLRAQEYHVDLEADNRVAFVSRASIEEFEGVTNRIDGFVLLSEPRLSTNSVRRDTEFYFEVDLASLDTGIGLRNRHMRDNYLEVDQYPFASLEGSIADVRASGRPGGFHVEGVGQLTIHGVTQALSTPCEVDEEGVGYHVRCSFEVLLSDYAIQIPKVMFLKLANDIRLELDFHLKPAPPG